MSSSVRNRRARSRSHSSADSPTPVAATVPAMEKSLSPKVLLLALFSVIVVPCAFLLVAATVPAVEKSLSLAVLPAFLLVLVGIVAVFTFLSFWILPDDRLQTLLEFVSAFGHAIREILVQLVSGLVTLLTKFVSGIIMLLTDLASGIIALLTDFASGLAEMLIGVGSVFSVGIQQLWAGITMKNISMMYLLAIVFAYFPDVSKKFIQVLEKSLTMAVPLPDK